MNGVVKTLDNVPRRYRTLKNVASIAAVAALAGSWFYDGTTLYVRPHDDRSLIGDTNILPTINTNNGRFTPTADNLTIYVEGVDFVGGSRAFVVTTATITATGGAAGQAVINTSSTAGVVVGQTVQGAGVPSGTKVASFVANTSITLSNNLTTNASGTYSLVFNGIAFAHKNCSFQGGGTQNGGLAILTYVTVYGYRSAAWDNYLDGFNYHSAAQDGTLDKLSPNAIEIECAAAGNGTTGSAGTSDNATTAHDGCSVIRINCVYIDSSDRPMADVNYAHSWNLGCHVGQALTAGSAEENIVAAHNVQMWLDSVFAAGGPNPRWVSAQTATIKHFNSGAVVNNSTAEATGNVLPYYG
jgi:hypothetical protein